MTSQYLPPDAQAETVAAPVELLPCPFCGSEAEADSMQAYRALSSGKIGTRFAIYCTSCNADMGFCHEDIESSHREAAAEQIISEWNTRRQFTCSARKQTLPEPSDCNWPFCGCDPYASKVLEVVEESGRAINTPDLLVQALEALRIAIEWIEGWGTPFTLDPEWPADGEKIRAILAQAKERGL